MSGARVLIPFRSMTSGKTRLSAVLSDTERTALSMTLFLRVLCCAVRAVGQDSVTVVTADLELAEALDTEMSVVHESEGDLNKAIAFALSEMPCTLGQRIAVLPADLVSLTVADVRALLCVESGEVLIAPDRHFSGTNGMAFCYGDHFEWCFGEQSFKRHLCSIMASGLQSRLLCRPGLSNDVDWPADLSLAMPARRALFLGEMNNEHARLRL